MALWGTQEQATQVTALIIAGATVVTYIISEGMIDEASAGAAANVNGNPTITGVSDESTDGKAAFPTDSGVQTSTECRAVAPNTNDAA